MKNKSNLSVVIASIGGDVLLRTIENLNQGSVVPDEIILVVPEVFASKVPEITCANLRYELVDFKGQVAQRAYGFGLVKSNYVLQLDDDIQLDNICVERLMAALKKLGPGHSVGPSIFYKGTNQSIYSMRSGFQEVVINIKAFLLSGTRWGISRMGRISLIGSCFGYYPERTNRELNPTEWIAGGCALHHKSSLVLEDYFPYSGKAYGEDLIHSVLLTNAGVKLFNVKSAICYIDKPLLTKDNYSLKSDYRVRLYLSELRGAGNLRIHLWYVLKSFRNFFITLLRLNNVI